MSEVSADHNLMEWTTEIVASHVRNSKMNVSELPPLIRSVHGALKGLVANASAPAPEPAVPIRRSVTSEYIICLEDGLKLKMLKRHLSTAYNLTPEQYREKWGLPIDYPMVAPSYARQRSALAKKIGLGRRRQA